MFLDSDINSNGFTNTGDNDISTLADENFLNHPGWLKDVFKPKKAEADRYEDEKALQKSNCNYGAGDNCEELQSCLDYFQNLYNSNTGNTRAPKRIRKAASFHMKKVNEYLAVRECSTTYTTTSEIDQSQSDESDAKEDLIDIKNQIEQITKESLTNQNNTFNQAQKMINDAQDKASKEKRTLMIGGGALVAIVLLVVVLKK